MNSKHTIVITSISPPNKAMKALADGAAARGFEFIVIGDLSSPSDFSLDGCRFLSLAEQLECGFLYAKLCPTKHYARKNIGYLLAFRFGADIVIDTDDDNLPRPCFWEERIPPGRVRTVLDPGWCNVYRYFTDGNIWPRGLPLNHLKATPLSFDALPETPIMCPIEQGLADNNPDVDAIFRLAFELPFDFTHPEREVALGPGAWCPFNSQNTRWRRSAFPLMYLPSFCSFRMTDIWRSFVAQRICARNGWGVLFHGATVWQERNDHDLMKDFADEVPGYLHNDKIVALLSGLALRAGLEYTNENLRMCYTALASAGYIDTKELPLLDAWLDDIAILL